MKSKRTTKLKAPRRLAPAHGSAPSILKQIIGRLKTHREGWRISRGNLKTLPSDGQLEILIRDLQKVLRIIKWPKCSHCSINPARGGKRQGSALCQWCYDNDTI